jgi:uncharacterized Zn finger protein
VHDTGSTWWAQRWNDALLRLGYDKRMARGRTYARTGRVHDLEIAPGEVRAQVTGTSPEPYRIHVRFAPLPDAVWTKAIVAMGSEAAFAAELLAGEVPQEIERAFIEADASLFPAEGAEIGIECSCPDWAVPCKHAAAVCYVIGDALDRDPFLLFELRGRTRTQVLGALRAARSGGRKKNGHGNGRATKKRPTSRSRRKAPWASDSFETLRAPLSGIGFRIDHAGGSEVLRGLGAPPPWRSESAPADVLGPVLAAAAANARAILLDEV